MVRQTHKNTSRKWVGWAVAEASTKDISIATNPETFADSKKVAQQGGNVAKVSVKELEAKTGKKWFPH